VPDEERSAADQTPARPAADSHVTLTQLMEVTDTNIAGNVHGGVIMRLADTAAAIAAIRHAGKLCVTVSVDELTFLEPVNLGDLVTVRASVNDVGTTSLECGVRVDAERPLTGARAHAATAYFVFVALDDEGKPTAVPPLLVETETERRRQREAKLRRAARMAHKEALRAQRRDGDGSTRSATADDGAPSERG
jgi:uncharacterized protein (TIGR00369 family)